MGTGELELSLLEELLKPVPELGAEDNRKGLDREQPLRTGGDPAFAVQGQPPSRDDAVQVIVVQEILAPAMEDGGDAEGGLEVVATKFEQGGRGTRKQKRIELLLVVLDERVQLVRESEHDVEVGNGQQILDLMLQPLGAVDLLATRAMAIATGIGDEVFLPAMGTAVMMATQRRSVTGAEGPKDLPVMNRQTMSL